MINVARLGLIPLMASIVFAACGDNTDPSEQVAGSYTATTFVATPAGGLPQDVLTAGGFMTITLSAAGATSGTLSIPASVTGEEAILESMQGTFTRSGNTIVFDQTADTFVPLASWTLSGNTISGTYANSGGTVQVVLTKS